MKTPPHASHSPSELWRFFSGFRAGLIGLVAAVGFTEASAQLTRVANTTLAFPQTPQIAGYTTEDAFPGLTFTQPLGIVTPPGETNRVFILEKTGRIQVVNNLNSTPAKQLFLDLSARVLTSSEQGLLGLAFHPNFSTNRYFYVFYSTTATTSAGSGAHQRVSRFTAPAGASSNADILATEVPLISQFDEADNHNGGDLHFGSDGYLYVSLGDEGGGNDTFGNSQRIDKDFFSGLLRIDVDQRSGNLAPNPHPSVHAGTYRVPADNPFVAATSFNGATVNPAGVRSEFWAVGLRNPWRFSFDVPTGRLFAGDVGQGTREEIDLIVRGGNYGWNYREGTVAGPRSNPPAAASFVEPIWDADRSVAGSITGGVVYRGSRFGQLSGQYVFGDYVQNSVFAMIVPATGPVQVTKVATVSSPSAFGADPRNGDVLIASIGTGIIRRLVSSAGSGPTLPATLTATGAFTNLSTLAPAPGIVPYEPNVSFWSDYAKKRRWFSVPALADKITFAAEGNWTFPTGTVWVKHFDLELTRGNASTARRLETRFIIKTVDGVQGLTYRWNSAQTEADLVPEGGADEVISINDGGVIRAQTWRYPSRSECLQCHTPAGGHALGFNTPQLNRTQNYGSATANQLTALAAAGYFTTANVPSPSTLRALAAADDTSATLEYRARSYLAANCVQCHQPGAPGLGSWDARIETPTASAGLINGSLVDPAGDSANRVMVPGDPAHSMLLARISLRGAKQMPPVASNEIDPAGVALLNAWINGAVVAPPPTPAPTITAQPVNQTVVIGHAVTFSAAGSGGTGQWQISTDNGVTWSGISDGGTYSGTTTNTLTISNATTGLNGARYRFVASNAGGSTNSSPATLAVTAILLPSPMGITVDSTGNLYVNDSTTNVLQRISTDGVVTPLAGFSGAAGSTDGTGTAALFNQPGGLVRTTAGIIYVSDTANATIRRVTGEGAVTTFAGSPTNRGNADGNGGTATFSSPMGIALDLAGNIYVADAANHTIRQINSAGAVTTFAGAAGVLGSNDGALLSARFNRPAATAVDATGSVYVADATNNTIRRMAAGVVTTFAGVAGISGSTDGTGTNALFNQPSAVAVDAAGNVYVADTGNSTIRKITPAGVVTTLAGLPTVAGLQDGTGNRAWFNQPKALALDSAGNVYVADTGNAALRKITPAGTVTTLSLTLSSTPPPNPTPNPPPTPTPTPTPTPGSGGGGGGSLGGWFAAGLFLLVMIRRFRSPLMDRFCRPVKAA